MLTQNSFVICPMKTNIIYSFLIILFITQCTEPENKSNASNERAQTEKTAVNQITAQIDDASLHLVNQMEIALGGREAYEEIEELEWNFFGARKWWWNKKTGDVICNSLKDGIVIEMNLDSKEGTVSEKGVKISDGAASKEYIDKGYNWWINDSYWLVMPFKLRDPGVHLKYLGIKETEAGENAEVAELTFDQVGITPQNKYELYFDPQTHMLIQWDFYGAASDTSAAFKRPWKGYETHAGVEFSTDRGARKINEIAAR